MQKYSNFNCCKSRKFNDRRHEVFSLGYVLSACGCVKHFVFGGLLLIEMEIFSLEEDDCNLMFLTQTSSQDNEGIVGENGEKEGESLMKVNTGAEGQNVTPVYEDISDDEIFFGVGDQANFK